MLHPYTIFFEELWREPERPTVDGSTDDELHGDELHGDGLADGAPNLHQRGGSEPTDGGPAAATHQRATPGGLWGAIVRLGNRHAR